MCVCVCVWEGGGGGEVTPNHHSVRPNRRIYAQPHPRRERSGGGRGGGGGRGMRCLGREADRQKIRRGG